MENSRVGRELRRIVVLLSRALRFSTIFPRLAHALSQLQELSELDFAIPVDIEAPDLARLVTSLQGLWLETGK